MLRRSAGLPAPGLAGGQLQVRMAANWKIHGSFPRPLLADTGLMVAARPLPSPELPDPTRCRRSALSRDVPGRAETDGDIDRC